MPNRLRIQCRQAHLSVSTGLCLCASVLLAGSGVVHAVIDNGLLCRIPFHGEHPFETGTDKARVVNAEELKDSIAEQGVTVGGGRDGVVARIAFDDWDVTAGTVSFWLTPADWDETIALLFGAVSEEKGHFRCDVGRYGLRVFGYGTDPGRTWNRIGSAKAESFEELQPGEWRHVALVWEKDKFITAYLDGEECPLRRSAFPWPDAFSQLFLGSTHPQHTAWTRVKDVRVYSRPLMAGEVAALAGQTMKSVAAAQANVTPVGTTETAPKIDGVLDPDEYPTVVPGLLDLSENTLYPEHAAVHTAVTDDHLFVAATLSVPLDYRPNPTPRDQDDERLLDADSFHLLIRSDTQTDSDTFSAAYLCLAPDGTLYDALETADWIAGNVERDATVDYGVHAASRIAEGRWIVETRIPLAKLGLSRDQPFSFALGYYLKDLSRKRISLQMHPQGFDHPQAFGIARCVPMSVSSRVGELARGTVDLELSLRNTGNEELSGQAEYIIAKPEIVQSEADWDYDQRIGEKIEVAASGKIQEWSTEFTLESGARDELSDTYRLIDPGSYLLVSQASVDGVSFYRRTVPFTYFSPIESSLRPVPSKQQIKADTSLYGVDLGGVDEIEFRLPVIDGGTQPQRFPVTAGRETFPLDMSDMPAGEHEIQIALLDVNGNEVVSRIVKFKKLPEPEWPKNRVALEALEPDWVPAPWTPMTVDGLKVGVWGRTFQFSNDSPLPRMTSQDTPLNTKPAKIAYTTDKGEFEIEIRDTRVESANKGRVVVRQTGESPHFEYAARHVIEFDGLDVITINLAPKDAVNLDALYFDIPLSSVRYFNGHRYNLGVLKDKQTFGKIHYLWLGGDAVGLDWVTENYQGWFINSTKPRVTVTSASGSNAILRLLLANEPVALNGPTTIKFSLQPTPLKPLPEGFREWRISTSWWEGITTHWIALWSRWSTSLTTPEPRNEQVMKDMVEHARKYGYKTYPYMAPSSISLNKVMSSEVPFFVNWGDFPDRFGDNIVAKKPENMTKVENAWYYAEDWQIHPQLSGGVAWNSLYACSTTSSFVDYFIYSLEEMVRQGLDGVYFDLASAPENFDPEKNMVYETLDGQTEGTLEVFATRDLYKRLYYVFDKHRGEENRPYILGHGYPIGMAFRSFFGVLFHGEGMKPAERFDMTRWYLQTRLKSGTGDGLKKSQASRLFGTDPDAERDYTAVGYRMNYPQRQIGIPMLILPQYGKATRDKETNRARYHDPALAREMLAFVVLHNNIIWPTWINKSTITDYWKDVEIPFDIGNTEFHGYWEEKIKTNANTIKASYWKKNGENDYLVAVANWSNEEKTARIILPAFIVERGPGLDMETKTLVSPVDEQGHIELTVPRNDLRVLRFCSPLSP